ncbi:MAG: antibiotic biosynthesis monooxygenase [Planctomycetota bacterium]
MWTRRFLTLLASLLASACTVSTPFRGPGFEDGRLGDLGADGTVVVALTQATLKAGASRAFFEASGEIADEMEQAPGHLGHSLRRVLFGSEAWTLSVWEDRDALRGFIRQPAHTEAMKRADEWIETFMTDNFEVRRSALPLSWGRAIEILEGAPLTEAEAP